MNGTLLRWRAWLWWLLPLAAFLVVLGAETEWGSRLHHMPDPAAAIEPKPVSPALLPEYQIEGGLAAHAETVSRTLFNPTRKPSPVVVADAQQRKQMQKGQFVLTGTTIAGDRNIAFVREVAGNKSRIVKQGDQINGMMVAEVKPDRVKLTLGDEAEDLLLKAPPGPRTTSVAPPAPAPIAGQPGAAPVPGQPDPGLISAATLEERRRAARAAQPSPAGAPTGVENAASPPPPAGAPQAGAPAAPGAAAAGAPPTDPAWAEVYRRMQRNQK